jgi:uncharacterized membrane protein
MNEIKQPPYNRLETIDLLRGLVIALMLLDHTRDFLHFGTVTEGIDPLDPEKSSVALYLTRWITHLCAPTFIFLAGISIRLQKERQKPNLSAHLFKRGLWLIFMELTLISVGWTFLPPTQFLVFQVIWAIGFSMVCMSVLVRLPVKVVLMVGLLICGLHNALFDGIQVAENDSFSWLWTLFHQPGAIQSGVEGLTIFVPYAFFPWLGVMMLGYGAGKWLTEKTPTQIAWRASGLLLVFIFLRWLNNFGDPDPWMGTAGSRTFFFSFFDVEKYPPSLLFMLATLGISGLLYFLLHQIRGPIRNILLAIGQVPFFFYLLHIYLVHILALSLHLVRGGKWADFTFGATFGGVPVGSGVELPVLYQIWILVLLVLYVPCRWFARVKARNRGAAWTSYI